MRCESTVRIQDSALRTCTLCYSLWCPAVRHCGLLLLGQPRVLHQQQISAQVHFPTGNNPGK